MENNTQDEGPRPSKAKWAVIAIVVIVIVAAVAVVVFEETAHKGPQKVTFYTWWATEGKIAVDKEYAAFHAAYPNLTAVSELKAGAGGSAAKGAILSLIADGNPPESFQTHYGPEMLSYIEAASGHSKAFVNMTSIADSMKNVVPQVLAAGTFNGSTFSLPVDAHRGAELYINPQLLYNNSIKELPQNVTALLADSAKLKSNGIPGWTIPGGDGGWDQMQVWEDLLLANSINMTGNAKIYDMALYGVLNTSTNLTVKNVVSLTNSEYLTALSEENGSMSTYTWTKAIPSVTGSQSGFQANGNWYVNYAYDFLNVTAYPMNLSTMNTTYDHQHHINLIAMPFPGTNGYFALVTDSVAVPVGSNDQAGITFAKYFSSYAGQAVFTKWKASTFYNNVTSPSFYNTPSQWGDYQALLNASHNSSRFVYQLSDGGLFDSEASSFESALQSFTSASKESNWNSSLQSIMGSEESSWKTANSLGFGFMGTLAHPFGNYLPPWVSNSTSASSSVSTASVNTSGAVQHSNDNGVPYSAVSFLVVLAGLMVIAPIYYERKR
ncbi:MAG: glucose ABC transporter substrate-binding protein GlcS [Thermoplasmataceae archaeon]|jgi:glucose/arabinose transport system substrate-binding protein